ncbi:hypothetical protein LTR04_007183 [Oleoguttula sp. CCFEE 6159]|nr:hypothetical protein LTR04_007183 [Oleoguttula sp. CCFEE 6159]
MAFLANVRYPLEFENGLVLRGPGAFLLPVAKLETGIQWHLVQGQDTKDLLKALTLYPDWYQTMDFESLARPRTFLGYCSYAQIHVGTEVREIKPSGIIAERDRLVLDREVPITINFKTPFFSIGFGTRITLRKSHLHTLEGKQLTYEDRLRRAAATPLLLYDSGTRIAWLVPELSVLLHMVFASLSHKDLPHEVLQSLRLAEPSADGGKAALSAIQSCNSIALWDKAGDDRPHRFMDVVTQFLEVFDSRKEEGKLARETLRITGRSGLRGWDFTDLKDQRYCFKSREIPAPLGHRPAWWELGEDIQTLVLFGRNIGDAIKPDLNQAGMCSSWASIPCGRDLLVASVGCLTELRKRCTDAESSSFRLTENRIWHYPPASKLFDDCKGSCKNPIQELWRRSILNNPNPPSNIKAAGAVIFGTPDDLTDYINHKLPCHPLGKGSLKTTNPRQSETTKTLEPEASKENGTFIPGNAEGGAPEEVKSDISADVTLRSPRCANSDMPNSIKSETPRSVELRLPTNPASETPMSIQYHAYTGIRSGV